MKDRAYSIIFAAAAVMVVLVAAPYRIFDLDRFFVPKELVLHAAALCLALLGLARARALEAGRADLLLGLYLALSAVSAALAPDLWLSTRALAVSLSGALVFWSVRSADGGTRRAIVAAAAAAAVIGAATSLLQAYGLHSDYFSLHRVPGGTLGNRNFMAHLSAICAPALLLVVLRARRGWAAAIGSAGLAVLAAALLLSRSRAALLGLSAAAVIMAYGLWRARAAADAVVARRLKLLGIAAALGLAAALIIPNTLEWKSRSPYMDTVTGLADYRKGSGHGRLVQYTRTLSLAASHPLLGVGPGNWTLVYPRSVDGFDPSIDYNTGRTMNPWPSSDWVAILSERGLPALAVMLLFFGFMFAGAWRRAGRPAEGDDQLEGAALAAVLAASGVVACFDALLLLPAPSLLVCGLAGALCAPSGFSVKLNVPRRALYAALLLVWGAALLRSAGQIASMSIYSKARNKAQVSRAALFDPGNARVRARLDALNNKRRPAPPPPPADMSAPDDDAPGAEQPEPAMDEAAPAEVSTAAPAAAVPAQPVP